MIHYSCDRCNRTIDPTRESHYVVKIEAEPVLQPLAAEELEDDRDHLAEINVALEAVDVDQEGFEPDEALRRTYDLCGECYQRFVRNPLGVDSVMHFGFSHN